MHVRSDIYTYLAFDYIHVLKISHVVTQQALKINSFECILMIHKSGILSPKIGFIMLVNTGYLNKFHETSH